MSSTASSGRSLRRNFTSILFGNSVYRLAQWLLIVIIARWGTVDMVGMFALAQAIAAPVFLTVGLNLRAARATDVYHHWSTQQYHRLRHVLNLISVALSVGIAWIVTSSAYFALVTLMLSLSKGTEATSQLTYGNFQLRERLDLMSRSMLLRTLTGITPFAIVLVLTEDLALSCLGLAIGWLVVTLLHDIPMERRLHRADRDLRVEPAPGATLLSLAKAATPLGVTAGIGSITTNVPRYAVQLALGTASLGLFAALAYLGQIVAMITGSLSDSLLGRLARTAQAGRPREFLRNLSLLSGFGVTVSIVVVIGGALFGEPLTRMLLGPEFVNQTVLVVLLAGSTFVTFQRTLARGLQGGRRFRDILVMDITTAVTTIIVAALAIPAFGLTGAAATLGAGFAAGSLVGIFFICRMVTAMRESERSTLA